MRAFALAALLATAAAPAPSGFDMVVLGARGGIEDGNLSSYLIRPQGDPRGVTCDAGTLVQGLRVAEAKGAFKDVRVSAGEELSRVGYVLKHDIKGYLISHPHLDHLSGLIIASPDDAAKPIYALPSVNAEIARSYFRPGPWSNFTDRGAEPRLGKYHVVDLKPGTPTPLAGTTMTVTPFPLAHGGMESTAFLLEHDRDAMLCFGDTGPDAVEHADKLQRVWSAVAGRVRAKQLKAIVIEVSFANDRPDDKLFGHLTPRHLLGELHKLEALAGKGSLKDLPIIIGHIKYALSGTQPQAQILSELGAGNDMGVRFHIAEQGQRWRF
ncbi:MBL fold metallo-hydrolase [Sphingomonas xinjiangensis]|uniref:3',5'-cyclic-nucleotide phosphodiesterase n=1 Tax=Sphingomonas xinjiangensis TaxID=643568 RepID=A0A840YMC1_9SPHN|nr:3',5'-cyclic-nucleotide phosphodiesterase [Sphingomonas xinjiangensis]MBB5710700.1 3',5'-cyclic-nucleotide phosphodiesterase [Sphingomonas xinjiangensis]